MNLIKLESNRLRTRELTTEDIQLWANFFEDEDAVEFFPSSGLEKSLDRSKQWIDKQICRYKDNGLGLFALIDKKSNAFIGQSGLLTQEVDNIKEIEVGYHIFKRYWGLGYAPEAAKLFIDYAFKNNLADSIISIIDIRNVNSKRVAKKNGLKCEKQTKWKGIDVYIYRIAKKDWNL